MRISDWSSDVCSSDLLSPERLVEAKLAAFGYADHLAEHLGCAVEAGARPAAAVPVGDLLHGAACLWEEALRLQGVNRSEEHTSELQSLLRNSYAAFYLNKEMQQKDNHKSP